MTESSSPPDGGAPYREPTLVPPSPPRAARRPWRMVALLTLGACAVAGAVATRVATRHVSTGPMGIPEFRVTVDDPCAQHGDEFGPVRAITVWQYERGMGAIDATVHPSGRWTRQRRTGPDGPVFDTSAGCVDALQFSPLFAAFADELLASSTERRSGSRETCVREYVTAGGQRVTTPGDRCAAPQLAEAILAAIPLRMYVAPPALQACGAAHCEITFSSGSGSNAPHSPVWHHDVSIRRDGQFVCSSSERDDVIGHIAPGEAVYLWLVGDVTTRHLEPPALVETPAQGYRSYHHNSVALRSGTGSQVFQAGFGDVELDPLKQRWRALSAMLPSGCY